MARARVSKLGLCVGRTMSRSLDGVRWGRFPTPFLPL
jgi:hypothetical protein